MAQRPNVRPNLFVTLAALVGCLVLVADACAQKKPPKPPPNPAEQAVKLSEAHTLRDAFLLLAEANHDYGGHRGKALHEIKEAIKILDNSIMKKGTPAQKAMAGAEARATEAAKKVDDKQPKHHEMQMVSDLHFLMARQALIQVGLALAQTNQHKPHEHVKHALEEIDAGLKHHSGVGGVERKLVEAEILRDAYLLMAEADRDYDGHRAKSMHHTKEAIKILDTTVLKKGTPMEKAITYAEERAARAAKEADLQKPQYHERQMVSDAQLRWAHYMLREARASLAKSKQTKPHEHVDNAIKELEIALMVR